MGSQKRNIVAYLIDTANLFDDMGDLQEANRLTTIAQKIVDTPDEMFSDDDGGFEDYMPISQEEYAPGAEQEMQSQDLGQAMREDVLSQDIPIEEAITQIGLNSKNFFDFANSVDTLLNEPKYLDTIGRTNIVDMINNAKQQYLEEHPEEVQSALKNQSMFTDTLKDSGADVLGGEETPFGNDLGSGDDYDYRRNTPEEQDLEDHWSDLEDNYIHTPNN